LKITPLAYSGTNRLGAPYDGGVQPNRGSLANATRKRRPLATAMRRVSVSRNPVLSKLFALTYSIRTKTRANNLRHLSRANRIINCAVACWVLFTDPIAKFHGSRRAPGLVVRRLGSSGSRSPRSRGRRAAANAVAHQWSSLSCGRKDTGSWRGMFFKGAPASLGSAPNPEPETSVTADLRRERVRILVTKDRVARKSPLSGNYPAA
jgi:hypothetical protein